MFKGDTSGGSAIIEIEIAIEIVKLPEIDFDHDFDFDSDPERPWFENKSALRNRCSPCTVKSERVWLA